MCENNNNGKRVIVTEKSRHDISDVEKYGKIVFMFDDSNDRPSIWADEIMERIEKRLHELKFDPNHDIIMAAGNAAMQTYVMLVLGANFRELDMIFYNTPAREYVKRTVEIP